MDVVSRRPKVKNGRQPHAAHDYCFDAIDIEEILELFPSPRYFQIHFSHIHDNCEVSKMQVDELRQKVDRIEQKLDRLLAALNQK